MRLPLLTFAALFPLITSAQTMPPLVPISSFARMDQYYNPVMSPDGKHLAMTVRVPVGARTVPMVSFYSLPDLKLEGTVRMPVFEVPADYTWVSNVRVLVQKAIEVGTREIPQATGELLAMDYDGKNQTYLYGWNIGQYGRNRYNPDEGYAYPVYVYKQPNDHLLIGVQQWDLDQSALYDLDTRTGIRKLVANVKAPNVSFVVDNAGKPRFGSGTDEDGHARVWRLNEVTTEWEIFPLQKNDTRLTPFGFSPDNRTFYAWQAEANGPTRVVSEDMTGSNRKLIASDDHGSVDLLESGGPDNTPLMVYSAVGRPKVSYLDPANPDTALMQELARQFPDHTVRLVNESLDQSQVLFWVGSDRDPGAYYLYNRKANKADMLFAAMEDIEPEHMAARRPVSFKARDGLQIDGYLTLPAFKTANKPPLILIPHGGPFGIRDSWYFDSDAQFLANRGYAVLQVNFRASGGRGRGFERAGDRQWGGKIMDDLVDGVKWTVAQGEVDGSKMCVYGGSFGGYSALMLASREPDLFKCAVGYAGVYDIGLLQTEDGVAGNSRRIAWNKRVFGLDKTEWERYSPNLNAASIKAGVLLIHGGKDKRAPKEHAFLMKEALEKAGHPPEWFYIDYEGHGFYDTENQAEVYRRLETFFARYLGKQR
ncbi:dipeptidyl aminopeptidase/acylaminoacyl peptidase [Duganella sp. 1224]|uniref:alpha/beta hydrolase family protein n=1 Tax=Duganella sp. 1224 TaxID=2587052 RepID=UPI0015C8AA52|nr:S9 family peptidase [Duganella sp. 1224]NYE63681.1 dipeptidyl aminopeptidase/acylaminoacyl peptidase [Duganella sp. 1224]